MGAVMCNGGPMLRDFERAKVPVLRQPLVTRTALSRLWLSRRLAAFTPKAEALVVWDPRLVTLVSRYASKQRLPWFYVATELPDESRGGFKNWARRLLLADGLMAFTPLEKALWMKVDPVLGARATVFPLGIDLALYERAAVHIERVTRLSQQWRLPEDRRVILVPDAFHPEANTTHILKAFSGDAFTSCIMVLLDHREHREARQGALWVTIAQHQLSSRVLIPQDALDWPAAYRLANLVVPAVAPRQGYSLRLLEAQAMGKPVIGFAQGGMADLLQDGVTGRIVPAHDAAALRTAMTEMLTSPAAEWEKMGKAAQDFARAGFAKSSYQNAMTDYLAAQVAYAAKAA